MAAPADAWPSQALTRLCHTPPPIAAGPWHRRVIPVNVATLDLDGLAPASTSAKFGILGLSPVTDKILSRRTLVAGLPLLLAGCARLRSHYG